MAEDSLGAEQRESETITIEAASRKTRVASTVPGWLRVIAGSGSWRPYKPTDPAPERT